MASIPYVIRSSHGNIHIRRRTGKVIRVENGGQFSELRGAIDRFDMVTAPTYLHEMGECDILDIGYWTPTGVYEPAVQGWAGSGQ